MNSHALTRRHRSQDCRLIRTNVTQSGTVDTPFTPDGARTRPPEQPNALDEIKRFERIQQMSAPMQSYVLPWLIHLVGDVHQPLHATARFTRDFPRGDR